MPTINFTQFTIALYGKKILQDLTFSVEEGEYACIIGPNGAGKSTLLKCINRIVKGGSGSIELLGKNIQRYRQKELGKLIGYVPQEREQAFSYTVEEFVMMGRFPHLKPFRPPAALDQNHVREAIAIVGLNGLENRSVNTLSGGERQKVFLATALAQQPKILLLDEPTNHLDPKYTRAIQKIIQDVSAKWNVTVLHVTHDLSLVAQVKKVVALKDGRLQWIGTPQEKMTPENLNGLFESEFLFVPHPVTRRTIVVQES